MEEALEPLTDSKVTLSLFGNSVDLDWGWLNNLYGSDVFDRMDTLAAQLSNYGTTVKGTWRDWRLIGSNVDMYNDQINRTFSPEVVAGLQTYVSELVAAILSGQDVSDEDMQHLQSVIDLINGMNVSGTGENFVSGMADSLSNAGLNTTADTLATDLQTVLDTAVNGVGEGAGAQVGAGVGTGMADTDMTGDAQTLATNTEAATEDAFQIHSPSRLMKPIGKNVAAGVGSGMTGYSFQDDASTMAGALVSAVNT